MPLRERTLKHLHVEELAVGPCRRFASYLIRKKHPATIADWDAKIALLTRELEDAHREQAATTDILKVISRANDWMTAWNQIWPFA